MLGGLLKWIALVTWLTSNLALHRGKKKYQRYSRLNRRQRRECGYSLPCPAFPSPHDSSCISHFCLLFRLCPQPPGFSAGCF